MSTFETPTPISVTVDLVGSVQITASDRHDTVVRVRPADDAKAADIRVAAQTRVEYADGALLVKAPKHWRQYTPFGSGGLIDVTIELPTGSHVDGDSSLGDFRGEGELGTCRLKTAMGAIRLDHTATAHLRTAYGNITVDRIDGGADVTTGSGEIHIGTIDGTALVKNSNGDTKLGDMRGELHIKASNGDILVDRARGSVTAKTANGDVRILQVEQGSIVVETGNGELEIDIPEGTAAWLDVSSRYGSVRNLLATTERPEPAAPTVDVRARTSCGDIVIGRAPTPAPMPTGEGRDR